MSSSDETGSVRDTAEPQLTASGSSADEDSQLDPWFDPGPKSGPDGETNWFLPTGRDGLRPDSVTWEDSNSDRDHGRAEAVGAPPWGGGSAPSRSGLPPPWEVGPWPGPGETAEHASGAGAAAPRRGRAAAASRPAQPLATDPQPSLVMPSRRLLLGIGGAMVLIVVAVVVIATSVSSGSAGGCATYPVAVRQAYAKAMSDVSGQVPDSVLAADLGQAASLANSSAASARAMTARTALFAMASDLDEAHADVSAGKKLSSAPALMQRLTADGRALPRSCP